MSTTSQSHIINAPKFLYGIRIAQLVLALIILGLAAYGVTFIAFDGISLTLFTALATIIITVYIGLSSLKFPFLYNYWAILGLDIFAVVFWIISFPLLASEVADWSSSSSYSCSYYYCYYYKKKRDLVARATTDYKTYRNAMAAAAAFGGVEFLLFVITLVIFSLHLHCHRKAGGHCVPATSSEAPTAMSEPANAPPVHAAPPTQVPVQENPQTQYTTPA